MVQTASKKGGICGGAAVWVRGLEGGLGNSNQLVEERFEESHKKEETHPFVRTPMTSFGRESGRWSPSSYFFIVVYSSQSVELSVHLRVLQPVLRRIELPFPSDFRLFHKRTLCR